MVLWVAVMAGGCGSRSAAARADVGARPAVAHEAPAAAPVEAHPAESASTQPADPPPAGLAAAVFAGGCFWCLEAAFERVAGVRDAVSGYTGGPELHPSYDAVSNHGTGHAEAVRVLYDPAVVSYERLLDVYWRHIDPTTRDQAFVDVGHQYRSAIYVSTPAERAAAERSLQALAAANRFGAPIVTTIEPSAVFWVAEAYHQDFYRTHPERYHQYHEHSGRREFLRRIWGPDADY
jgi:methionine-S-sulfoxide reductase